MRAFTSKLLRYCVCLGCVCLSLLILGGCAKVEGKKFSPYEGVQETDQAKVRKFLEEAEIKGEVMRMEEQSDGWIVEIQPAPPADGTRRRDAVLGLKVYHVNKVSGKVTDKGYTGG
jgi:hypothetical protein